MSRRMGQHSLTQIVANLYTVHLEQVSLHTPTLPPKLWLQYVNDTLCGLATRSSMYI